MYTSASLTAVETALARGELEVEYADRRVRYHSLADLRALRSEIIHELAQDANASADRPRQFFASAGKGLA